MNFIPPDQLQSSSRVAGCQPSRDGNSTNATGSIQGEASKSRPTFHLPGAKASVQERYATKSETEAEF